MQRDAHNARIPFTPADTAAADAFLWMVRAQGVRVAIAGGDEMEDDVLAIYNPTTCPWHSAEVRWTGFRDASGVWLDDFETGERHGREPRRHN